MKSSYFGWIVAAALVAVAVTTGFQDTKTKIGVVDMTQVFNDSDFAKTQVDSLKALGQARQDMLSFVDQWRVFTPEQATRFHDLSLKTPISAAEKTELDQIKTAVQNADKRLKELQTKANPTADESKEMSELTRRVQTTTDAAQKWSRDAGDEVDSLRNKLQKETLDKVRDAVKQIGTQQGYTIIFVTDVAPYGANNVTADALKVMNKK
jgi:Skp family chaperone for outer membrane proteins